MVKSLNQPTLESLITYSKSLHSWLQNDKYLQIIDSILPSCDEDKSKSNFQHFFSKSQILNASFLEIN